jgi:cyanophycin synthetase
MRHMKIIQINVMRGPNYWSNYRSKLIVMKLDLEESEDFPTNTIDGFADRLEELMPTLQEHRCSYKKPGGFFQRVREGTWLGHVVEHVALELQSLGGMPCGFGRTRSTGEKGVYHVVFDYKVEAAGLYAAHAAVRLVQALESDMPYDISADIAELMRINRNEGMGPSTKAIVDAAMRKGIPYRRLNTDSLVMLGQGVNQKIIQSSMACTTSSIGVDIASDKAATRSILADGYIPVAKGISVYEEEELEEAIVSIGFPLVVKPVDANHGKGVTTNINDIQKLKAAFQKARGFSDEVIIEKFVKGMDFRFLVVNYQLEAVARRTPAMVRGDDASSIQELIDRENGDPARGQGHEKVLTKIKVDEQTHSILVERNLTLNSILPVGEILFLKDTANLSTGGTANDATDVVHPHNIFLAERIARLMNLDICGIDIIAEDITQPITEDNGAVIEVNAGPGLRMHLSPSKGIGRDVGSPVINMLYPGAAPSRIPVVAVTGTNGKTTTTRLIAHMARASGHSVGYTTTDGIYINDEAVHYGDCSGPASAELVLRDPIVDFAVLECARGGILRSGLGFDKCNISIVTNITGDHLGIGDIHTLEQLAQVKGVVPRSTMETGYAILNADDDLVYDMHRELDCQIALFSMDEKNARIRSHCADGALAAVVEKGHFTLLRGNWKTRIARVNEVPLTLEGKASCMIKNILPAILAASLSGFHPKAIKASLMSFVPGPEQTPGRMNVFGFPGFQVMVDYVHNTDGFRELKTFMEQVDAFPKVGIIGCAGDRRDGDIISMAESFGEAFDKVIIRHDEDGRGRTNENLTELIARGLHAVKPGMPYEVISDEIAAVEHAINHATEGSFILVCSDHVRDTIARVQQRLNNSKQRAVSIH